MSIKQKTFTTFIATFAVALALSLSVAPMAAKKMRPEPSPAQLQADLQTQRVARGKYIVSTAGCHDCHTPWKMGRSEERRVGKEGRSRGSAEHENIKR